MKTKILISGMQYHDGNTCRIACDKLMVVLSLTVASLLVSVLKEAEELQHDGEAHGGESGHMAPAGPSLVTVGLDHLTVV